MKLNKTFTKLSALLTLGSAILGASTLPAFADDNNTDKIPVDDYSHHSSALVHYTGDSQIINSFRLQARSIFKISKGNFDGVLNTTESTEGVSELLSSVLANFLGFQVNNAQIISMIKVAALSIIQSQDCKNNDNSLFCFIPDVGDVIEQIARQNGVSEEDIDEYKVDLHQPVIIGIAVDLPNGQASTLYLYNFNSKLEARTLFNSLRINQIDPVNGFSFD